MFLCNIGFNLRWNPLATLAVPVAALLSVACGAIGMRLTETSSGLDGLPGAFVTLQFVLGALSVQQANQLRSERHVCWFMSDASRLRAVNNYMLRSNGCFMLVAAIFCWMGIWHQFAFGDYLGAVVIMVIALIIGITNRTRGAIAYGSFRSAPRPAPVPVHG